MYKHMRTHIHIYIYIYRSHSLHIYIYIYLSLSLYITHTPINVYPLIFSRATECAFHSSFC